MEFTKDLQLKRITSRYPYLFPLGVTPQRFKEIANLVNKQPKGNLLIYSNKDELKPTTLSLLLKDKPQTFLFMNAYRVVDIFLQQDTEYQSLSQLRQSHLLIYVGYNEMTNQRLLELLLQLLSYRSNLTTYIFLKGNTPINQALLKQVHFPKLYLNAKPIDEEVF